MLFSLRLAISLFVFWPCIRPRKCWQLSAVFLQCPNRWKKFGTILKRENKTQGTDAKSVQYFSPQCILLSCTGNPAHWLGNCSTSLGAVKWKYWSQLKSMVAYNHLSPTLLKAFNLKASVDHYKGCGVSITDNITISSLYLATCGSHN